MSMVYRYISVGTSSFNVDLGSQAVRLASIQGFSEKAEHVAVGSSAVIIDNPTLTVGHSSDNILGLQLFTVTETDCSAGNQLLYYSTIGTREYGRGSGPTSSLRTGAAGEINVTLFDQNAVLGFRVIPQSDTAAKRPAETVAARLTWILGSTYLSGLVADNGLVADASAFGMDAANYQGQRPTNVINDCELASGWWAFVYIDETQTVIPSLFFDDANASTAYSTSLRLTNVLVDVDNVTTFAVEPDFKLRRVPDDLGSGAFLPYSRGAVYRTRAATAAIYGYRDTIAPNSNVKTAAKANAIADIYLWQHHTEEDRLIGTVKLPSQYVNNLRAGQRLQVKFSNLPGYTSYTWVRCLARAPGQREETDKLYQVAIELSPQEAAPPAAAIVQSAFGHTADGPNTLSLPNPVTIGNLLVYVVSAGNTSTPSEPNIGVTQPHWGTGAWTKDPNTTIRYGYGSGGGGLALWYKTADSTNQTGQLVDRAASYGIYEITGGDISSATVVSKTLQAVANPMTIGSLGTAATNSVAIMVGNWADASLVPPNPPADPTWTGTANGWTTDSLYWVPAVYPRWNPPVTYIAHQLGAGSSISASGTRGALQWLPGQWAGIAILIPPL